jgi:hypothetical protein
MPTLQIEHGVADYAVWKESFDRDPVGREPGGVRRYRISRPADDPNVVIIELDFDTHAEAEAFHRRLDAQWAGAGANLGLRGLRARILELEESVTY